MFCASRDGWTKQGDGYFRGHVRYVMQIVLEGGKHEGRRTSPSRVVKRQEANGTLGGMGCVRAKSRACGAFPSLTWKPSVAQADEDGFSLLAGREEQIHRVSWGEGERFPQRGLGLALK